MPLSGFHEMSDTRDPAAVVSPPPLPSPSTRNPCERHNASQIYASIPQSNRSRRCSVRTCLAYTTVIGRYRTYVMHHVIGSPGYSSCGRRRRTSSWHVHNIDNFFFFRSILRGMFPSVAPRRRGLERGP